MSYALQPSIERFNKDLICHLKSKSLQFVWYRLSSSILLTKKKFRFISISLLLLSRPDTSSDLFRLSDWHRYQIKTSDGKPFLSHSFMSILIFCFVICMSLFLFLSWMSLSIFNFLLSFILSLCFSSLFLCFHLPSTFCLFLHYFLSFSPLFFLYLSFFHFLFVFFQVIHA